MTEGRPTEASEQAEGIIQFAYDLQPSEPVVAALEMFGPLRAWRQIFRQLGLLGQDPGRYGGLGFGNLSARDPERPGEFVITASQTGGEEDLTQDHLTRVVSFNLQRFWVDACGSRPPSSETMTHAMLYAADSRIEWVFHCHCEDIWQNAENLALPCTDPEVVYGSPEMVRATASVLETFHSRPLVFATLGHTDGIFACGPTARDTGGLLVSYLAKSLS
jgi:L-ribulose-5-phosphate 4-epimerase